MAATTQSGPDERLMNTRLASSTRSHLITYNHRRLNTGIGMKSNFLSVSLTQIGFILVSFLLASCKSSTPSIPQSNPTPPPSPASTPVECATLLPTNPPPSQLVPIFQADTQTGVCIYGHLALNDGPGLENVRIYLSLAAYPGEIVATTDRNGDFLSDVKFIPGDENVTVWAELEGYIFNPPNYRWRHYHGLELRTLNFTADSSR